MLQGVELKAAILRLMREEPDAREILAALAKGHGCDPSNLHEVAPEQAAEFVDSWEDPGVALDPVSAMGKLATSNTDQP